jgi:uncharacterized protein YbaP (TraB family)
MAISGEREASSLGSSNFIQNSTRSWFWDRYRKWVPRFKKMLSEKKPAMVVLGHFHLVGSDGVLAQLQAGGNDSPKGLNFF